MSSNTSLAMQQQKKSSEPMNLLRTQSNTLDIKSERILNRMPQHLPLTMPSTPTSSTMPQVNSLTDENLINEMSSSMASIPTNSFNNNNNNKLNKPINRSRSEDSTHESDLARLSGGSGDFNNRNKIVNSVSSDLQQSTESDTENVLSSSTPINE